MGKVNITPNPRRGFACQNGKWADLAWFSDADRRRFWAKVDRGPDGACWPWLASRLGTDGYGQFTLMTPGGISRKQLHLYAHRVAWIVTYGDIPEGISVLHSCDTPTCVNPAHLFLGTQLDNMRDAAAKGRLSIPKRRTRRFKQTAITRYLDGGVTLDELAAEYSVHKLTIHRWVRAATGGADQRAARHARKRAA